MPNQPTPSKIHEQDKVTLNRRKKKKGRLGLIFVCLAVVVGVGIMLYMNRQWIAKQVAQIPVLNKIFKEVEDPYSHLTKEALVKQLEVSEANETRLEEQLKQNSETIQLLEEKIDALRKYEIEYGNFMEQKNNWDSEIAKTNPALFIEQYEAMNPEIAQNIYKELVKQEEMTKEQKKHAQVVAEMEEEQAARALEKLLTTDPELVKVVFKGMALERQGLILSEMQSQYAAQVIKLISP